MLSNTILATALLAVLARAAPLPLNINLGAYSPALVVGDGAMSFEEANAVNSIVQSLQGAATAGAAARSTEGAAEAVTLPATEAAGTTASRSILSESATLLTAGQALNKEAMDPRDESESQVQKRQDPGFDRALKFAEVALTKGPNVQLGTGEHGSGVGIIVENTPVAKPARTAETGAAE